MKTLENYKYTGVLNGMYRPLEPDETAMLVLCSITDGVVHSGNNKSAHENNLKLPEYKAISDKLSEVNDISNFSVLLLLFIAFLTGGSRKNALMWAYTLNLIQLEAGERLTFQNSIGQYLPPNNVPSKEGYEKAWLSQKGYNMQMICENFLDDIKNWPKLSDEAKQKIAAAAAAKEPWDDIEDAFRGIQIR